jgi:parallel beta-helix repeat protein
MQKRSFLLSIVLLSVLSMNGQEKLLTKGMVLTKTTRIKEQVYKLDAAGALDQGVIIIEGDNITVDFNNAQLQGSNTKKTPDEFAGVALLIRNGKNITIKNLKARGYKIALLARNVEGLTISNCDFSYNYRPKLNSTQEKEDISDWMSYHHNEKDEWLRYGAAIYLRDCNKAVINNSKVTGGQNALMMTGCNEGRIYNNDFSFNSGIGIGMYRCSQNEVLYNRIIFNVRGYSHGVYNRGQDSAGILVYEQSNKNLFYKNNVTHGGDGFFLWAGQTTMDSGKGGCNDNALVENDFSYAPTNGIEVTFSRNYIYKNRIFECDHGIWGGYSYNTRISHNRFRFNRVGIAIEHGQENVIDYNVFYEDKEAIRLWARREQPANWGYAKNRDTRSRQYVIAQNSFNNHPTVLNLNRTEHLTVFGNRFIGSEQIFKMDSTVTELDTVVNEEVIDMLMADTGAVWPVIKNPKDPFKGANVFAGRKNIMMTEWGPYDFLSPIIWHANPKDSGSQMKFDLLGPAGKWKIKKFRGVKDISLNEGTFPASVTAEKIPGDRTDIFIEVEYNGKAITTPFGKTIAAGKPYLFSFKKFFQPISFFVRWYMVDTAMHHPIKTGILLPPNARLAPFKTEQTTKLDYAWWGGIKGADKQHTQFATLADGEAEFAPGTYELGVTWDDAVRVYVDGKLVIDEWNPSLYKFDESPNKKVTLHLGGKHNFTVEHVELGGFATLSLKIKPAG